VATSPFLFLRDVADIWRGVDGPHRDVGVQRGAQWRNALPDGGLSALSGAASHPLASTGIASARGKISITASSGFRYAAGRVAACTCSPQLPTPICAWLNRSVGLSWQDSYLDTPDPHPLRISPPPLYNQRTAPRHGKPRAPPCTTSPFRCGPRTATHLAYHLWRFSRTLPLMDLFLAFPTIPFGHSWWGYRGPQTATCAPGLDAAKKHTCLPAASTTASPPSLGGTHRRQLSAGSALGHTLSAPSGRSCPLPLFAQRISPTTFTRTGTALFMPWFLHLRTNEGDGQAAQTLRRGEGRQRYDARAYGGAHPHPRAPPTTFQATLLAQHMRTYHVKNLVARIPLHHACRWRLALPTAATCL